jgi:hypothetical protein
VQQLKDSEILVIKDILVENPGSTTVKCSNVLNEEPE